MSKHAMRLSRFLAVILLAAAQSAFADDWFSHYYESPAPERFVTEVQALSKAGNLSNPNTAAMTSVFFGRVMAANPAQVNAWLTELGNLKGNDRQTVLLAANLSKTKEARAYLDGLPDAEKYRAKAIDIRAVEPNNPAVLDMLWADFFATGELVPVRRIVVALNYGKYSGDLDRYAKSEKTEKDRDEATQEAVFKAAMGSLESNATQHRWLGETLEYFYFASELTQPERHWLSVILAKVMPKKYEMIRAEAGQWTLKRKLADPGATGWQEDAGQAIAGSDSMKRKDRFTGLLLATRDDDWKRKWNAPPGIQPTLTRSGVVPYGKPISILTLFASPKLDSQGQANVKCDFRLLAPTGKVAREQKDAICFAGAIEGSPDSMRVSAHVISFSADPEDLPGAWVVEVMLRDVVRNVELLLRTSFLLKRP